MSLNERLNPGSGGDAKAFPHVPKLGEALNIDSLSIDHSDIKAEVHNQLITMLGHQLYEGRIETRTLERHVFESISRVIVASGKPLTAVERATLLQEIVDEILGLGPLQPLLRDDEVTEIMVNRFDQIYVERHGRISLTRFSFTGEEHLRRTIERIVSKIGRRIDESSPLVDARLSDGSRVNAVVPPIALAGSTLTIRKFARDAFTARDMVSTGTFTKGAMDFLGACVKGRMNILISGGTGSGKTTTLNVLSSFISPSERIITIEDAAELQLPQPHVIRLESRPSNVEGKGLISIRDLVKNTLRMRPDRIIVGEVRDAAALDMLQAMNTGHDGSLTTIHANNPREALLRLETLVLMAGTELPVKVIREQMSQAIDLIVQQSRLRDGSRQVTAISEILEFDGETIHLQDIFRFEYYKETGHTKLGELVPTGTRPNFLNRLAQRGVQVEDDIFSI